MSRYRHWIFFFFEGGCQHASWLGRALPNVPHETTTHRIWGMQTSVSLHPRGSCSDDVFTLSLFSDKSRKDSRRPLTQTRCRREGHLTPLFPRMRTRISELQFSLVIFNYHECLVLAIWSLPALFIYLFIYSVIYLFNFLWAVQLRYIAMQYK